MKKLALIFLLITLVISCMGQREEEINKRVTEIESQKNKDNEDKYLELWTTGLYWADKDKKTDNGNNISCISTHASASTPLQRHRPAGACKQLGIFLFLRLGESPLFRDRESPEYRLEESRCRCRQRQCRFPIAHLPG